MAGPLVLVVDDDEDHATMLEVALEGAGFRVLTAHSVAEARAVLGARPIDALVSDLGLGDGTCFDILVDAPRKPRIAIVLSGSDAPDDVERSHEAGFFAHLVKPTSVEELSRVIAEGLRRSSGAYPKAGVVDTKRSAR